MKRPLCLVLLGLEIFLGTFGVLPGAIDSPFTARAQAETRRHERRERRHHAQHLRHERRTLRRVERRENRQVRHERSIRRNIRHTIHRSRK